MPALLFAAIAVAQTHDLTPAKALEAIDFMKGDWAGRQVFNTQGGPAMEGAATDKIESAIGGRYLYEALSTTLPGRKPTDTRHLINYDPKAGKYRAWWYTDTTVGPMEFEGELVGDKLVMTTHGANAGRTLRATYTHPDANTLTYTLEMKVGEGWQRLFVTTYTKR